MNKIMEAIRNLEDVVNESGLSELDKADVLESVSKLKADVYQRHVETDDSASDDERDEDKQNELVDHLNAPSEGN